MIRSHLRGFTLIELMICLVIIMMLSGVMLANYPDSVIKLNLANNSHSTALLLREAQVRGSAVDTAGGAYGGYGVYFDSANRGYITLFGDLISVDGPYGVKIGDGVYQGVEAGPLNETKSLLTFQDGYTFSKICVGASFPFTCGSNHTPAITSLVVSFTRPSPQAHIYINNATDVEFPGACIELRTPRPGSLGHVRSVQVFTSGMIRTFIGACDNNPS